MKNNDLDLSALENADEEMLEKMAESYQAVTKKDIARLFERTEKKTNVRTEEAENITVVSGVEVYRRPVWRKILATASAIVIAAGACVGGFVLLRSSKSKPDTLTSQTETTAATAQSNPESSAPFGDISGGRIRFMVKPSDPCVLELLPEKVMSFAEAFNSTEWELIGTGVPENPYCAFYVSSGGQAFTLRFGSDNTVYYEHDGVTEKYRSSSDAPARLAQQLQLSSSVNGTQMYYIPGDVWRFSVPYPLTLLETPEIPAELEGKSIIDTGAEYDYAFDITDIRKDAENSDDIIIGRVDGISYRAVGTYENGCHAETVLKVTVISDTRGICAEGSTVGITTPGGYISMRDMLGEKLTQTGGKYGNGNTMTDEEIDNTWYHDIVGSGELPVIGQEYAFLVVVTNGKDYPVIGNEYGMLYKYDDCLIQRTSEGLGFYTIDELEAMMNGSYTEPATTTAATTSAVTTTADPQQHEVLTTTADPDEQSGKVTTAPAKNDKASSTTTTATITEKATTTAGTPDISRLSSGNYVVSIGRGEVYEWTKRSALNGENGLIVSNLPGIVFCADDTNLWYERGTERVDIHTDGFSLWYGRKYFTDVTGDGYPDLCYESGYGSGIDYHGVNVYDVHNDVRYSLDPSYPTNFEFDFTEGRLLVKRIDFNSDYRYEDEAIVRYGELAVINGRLTGVEVNLSLTDEMRKKAAACDLNSDGRVSVYDAHVLLDYYIDKYLTKLSNDCIEDLGDINGSGDITSLDSAFLLAYLKESAVPGDINEDGLVNSADEDYLRYYIENYKDFQNNINAEQRLILGRCEAYGDLNFDGKVGEEDLTFFSRK